MTVFYVRYGGGLANGEQWVSGLHLSGGGTLAEVAALLSDAFTAFWTQAGADIPSTTTVVTGVAYELDPVTGKATARAEASVGHVGGASDHPNPNQVSAVATLRTATPGPRGRGRMYWPGPSQAGLTATGLLTSVVAGNYADGTAEMLAVYAGSSLTPILFTKGHADRPITSVDVSEVPGTQRRRRNKVIAGRMVGS